MSSSLRSRGQALVLLCLTMLLITLMVCLTLSFSMRVREKMEAQSVADLAAYSGAVATARTFNSIALMRRAQTGHLVASSATMSLISWTSMMRANLNVARSALQPCPAAVEALRTLNEQTAEIEQKWHEMDARAGVQAYNIHLLGGHLGSMQGMMFEQLKESVAGGQNSFTQQMAAMASKGSRFPGELHAGPTPVSVGELVYATSGGYDHALDMAMATRGHEFITRRQGMPDFNGTQGILGVLSAAGARLRVIRGGGSAYWGKARGHGGRADAPHFTWAEDHALVEVTFPGCAPLRTNAWAYVKATDLQDESDEHAWSSPVPGIGRADPGMEKQYRHTLLPCFPRRYCPSTFIGGMAYNTGDREDGNIWAQPKIFALAQRDYKARGGASDPWNLRFNFQFSQQGSSAFDNHGLALADGTDISVQSALATGLAYYHRRGHWNEPPNLWNPFWRATLVSADIDSGGNLLKGGTDVPDTVGAPGAAAFEQLVRAGYKGVH
ncbi:pilus assembly protein TadG-related protein [Stigmatella sp. ncwal1]|uniref:Pilus assembly protein TadG-related protein n=1 Tax=Stigmatella ashevillensis TaxID=2995309 RepID=A0ABT5DGS4_9BACT|nr:pilus assembly protein TadG-related protein [Stigmatella ashevillena]MDC0712871.1 pilus assembly protein TadG-related protein [Stigmatella ashevillena]